MKITRFSIYSGVFFSLALIISIARKFLGTDDEFETMRIVFFWLGGLCSMIDIEFRKERETIIKLIQQAQPGNAADATASRPHR